MEAVVTRKTNNRRKCAPPHKYRNIEYAPTYTYYAGTHKAEWIGSRYYDYDGNGNLPGMGGVFNYVNLHAYHYAGNNPVKYTDPDGDDLVSFEHVQQQRRIEARERVRSNIDSTSWNSMSSKNDLGFIALPLTNKCNIVELK